MSTTYDVTARPTAIVTPEGVAHGYAYTPHGRGPRPGVPHSAHAFHESSRLLDDVFPA